MFQPLLPFFYLSLNPRFSLGIFWRGAPPRSGIPILFAASAPGRQGKKRVGKQGEEDHRQHGNFVARLGNDFPKHFTDFFGGSPLEKKGGKSALIPARSIGHFWQAFGIGIGHSHHFLGLSLFFSLPGSLQGTCLRFRLMSLFFNVMY